MLKPDMRMIWANSGDVVTPPESKIDLGWILEKPPSQYFNWHLNRTDRMLNHINRRGIPSWSSDTEYHTNGISSYVVGSNGRVYVSVAPSGNNTSPAKDPTTDTTREYWKPAFVGWDEAIPESQITGLTAKLNSKVDKTQRVNTSNGLSGGGTLSGNLTIRPTYGTTANTVTQGNDPRLSNSREWSAATVGEAEAKAGTATTRRAWTAQRVHQAAEGWHDKKFSTIVKNILSRSNAQQIRNDLQLGTAATRNVGNALHEVVEVQSKNFLTAVQHTGYFAEEGVGILQAPAGSQGFLRGSQDGFSAGGHVQKITGYSAGEGVVVQYPARGMTRFSIRTFRNGEWESPLLEVIHTGNILSSTGNSTSYPMTQAAATAALNQKVSNTTSIIAGTGLEGGGTLSQNRTLSVKYGTTAGTAVEGNDSRVVNALQKGNNLADVPNKTLARQYLGLGSAATRDVGTGSGNLMEVGAFGLGSRPAAGSLDSYTSHGGYFGTFSTSSEGNPLPGSSGGYIGIPSGHADKLEGQLAAKINNNSEDSIFFRHRTAEDGWLPWVELTHSGNILSSTGTSSQYPMTQAAVTSALNTKADTSYVDTELDKKATVGTGGTQVRTNSQLDSRYVQGQAGTSGTQFRNNSQNDSRYIQGGSVVQATGSSTTNVMSQRAVTDALAEKVDSSSVSIFPHTDTIPQRDASGGVEVALPTSLLHATNKGYVDTQIRNAESRVTDKMLGVGQTWQDVLSSRSANTVYTNTTNKPIMVSVSRYRTSGSQYVRTNLQVRESPDDAWLSIAYSSTGRDGDYRRTSSVAIVPPNHQYRESDGVGENRAWHELR